MRGGRDGIVVRSASGGGVGMWARGTMSAIVRGLNDGRAGACVDGEGGVGGRGLRSRTRGLGQGGTTGSARVGVSCDEGGRREGHNALTTGPGRSIGGRGGSRIVAVGQACWVSQAAAPWRRGSVVRHGRVCWRRRRCSNRVYRMPN